MAVGAGTEKGAVINAAVLGAKVRKAPADQVLGKRRHDVQLLFERDVVGDAQKLVELGDSDGREHLLDVTFSMRRVHGVYSPASLS